MATTLDEAFAAVPRTGFLPPAQRQWAHLDIALPIGHDATNSQPSTVRFMLEQLRVRPGDWVLDVGCGSGWTTALLAELVGPGGGVLGVDIVPELVSLARANLEPRFTWVRCEVAKPGVLGWPDEAPYDRILVSAAADEVPGALVGQLGPGGRMVVPVVDRMMVVESGLSGTVTATVVGHHFSFVPLR